MFTLLLLFLVVAIATTSASQIGLNAGAQFDTSNVPLVKASGAKWVRLNFIVTQQQSGTSDPSFVAMYDGIINAYRASNITIYGLIGAEAVKSGYNRNDPGSFIDPFKTACSDIIPRWQDKVRVFELFNEPNDWAGGNSAQMTPFWFAKLLQSVYELKFYNHWSAMLVSGPLFSFDGTDASDYLFSTYEAGMTQLAWDWFHQNAGKLFFIHSFFFGFGRSDTSDYSFSTVQSWNDPTCLGLVSRVSCFSSLPFFLFLSVRCCLYVMKWFLCLSFFLVVLFYMPTFLA